MSLIDKHFAYLPEYTHDMHRNYNEAETLTAFRKKMRGQVSGQETPTEPQPVLSKIKITTEVKMKK